MSEALRFPWGNERRPRSGDRSEKPTPRRPANGGAGRDAQPQARRASVRASSERGARIARSAVLTRPRAIGPGFGGWSGGLGRGTGTGPADERRSSRSDDRDTARDRLPGRVVEGPQRERHEPDYVLLLAAVALSSLGILMVLSTEGVKAALDGTGDVVDAVAMQLVWAVTGTAALIVSMRMDYRLLRYTSIIGYGVAIGLLVLVFAPEIPGVIAPIEIGNAARWLSIGGLPSFHPAEIAKLFVAIYLAHWLASRGPRVGSLREGTIPFLLIAGPVIALVAVEPDLGTTGVMTLMAFTMFFVAGASLRHLAVLVPLGVVIVAIVLRDYQADRIEMFLDPWKVANDAGYQTVRGIMSLGLGGVLGVGLGQSDPHAGGLAVPNSGNDFIFAVVGQELGLVGGVIVIVLFTLLAWRGVRISMNAPDTFGGLLALGITAWLAFQAFINIGVVVHLLPLTGVPLPFVSDGGTSLVVSLAAVGILLSISRETSRGSQTDEDRRGSRWHRRPHLPGLGRRPTLVRDTR